MGPLPSAPCNPAPPGHACPHDRVGRCNTPGPRPNLAATPGLTGGRKGPARISSTVSDVDRMVHVSLNALRGRTAPRCILEGGGAFKEGGSVNHCPKSLQVTKHQGIDPPKPLPAAGACRGAGGRADAPVHERCGVVCNEGAQRSAAVCAHLLWRGPCDGRAGSFTCGGSTHTAANRDWWVAWCGRRPARGRGRSGGGAIASPLQGLRLVRVPPNNKSPRSPYRVGC